MSDIDLPTLVQRIRVDTSSLDRAERVAKAFGSSLDDEFGGAGAAADDFAGKADKATQSTERLGHANDDTRTSSIGAAGAVERLGESTRRTTAAVNAGHAATSKATTESDALRIARLRLAVASNDVEGAERKLNAARDGGKVEDVVRGEYRLAEAVARRARAEQDVRRAGTDNDKGSLALRELAGAADKAGNATSFLGRMMSSLKIPAIGAGISALAGIITALGAGVVALIGQLGPLVGILGSLPAAIGAIGSVKGVFTGLVKGPAAAAAAVAKAADATTSSARTIRNADRAVEDASRRATDTQVRGAEAVGAARQNVADTTERAADQVRRAEENLTRAQEDSKRAQEDLTRARDDAREKLQDMALSVRQAALDEEAGRIALAKARENLDNAKASGDPRAIQEADLAYRQQVLTLDTIIERNDDLATEAKKAQKQGVDGADNVVAANKQVADTQAAQKQAAIDLARAQRDSARSVVQAQKDLARTIHDTAEANVQAQRAVADAREAAGEAHGGGKAGDAMKDLTPAGRAFADQLVKVQARMTAIKKEAQGIALPGLTAGLKSAMSLMPSVRSGYLGVAGVIGKTGKDLGTLAASGPFGAKFAANVASNTRVVGSLAGAIVPIVNAINNIMYAARGMSEAFAKAFGDGARKLSKMSEDTPRLEAFFARTTKLVFSLSRSFRDLGIGLKNVFGIGAKSIGIDFTGNLESAMAKFRKFTESVSGQNKIAKFFADTKPTLVETGKLVRDIIKAFGHFGTNSDVAPLISQIRTELLPALIHLGDVINKNVGPTIVKVATAFLDFQSVLAFSPIIAVANAMAEFVIQITKVIGAVPGLAQVVATLLAFNLALKGIAVAGKVSGLTGVVGALSKVGPAGAAGQKGLAGFVQGLRGVDKAGNAAAGRSTTIANKIGGAFSSIPGKLKGLGSSIASGIGKGITASKSIATSAASSVARAGSAVATAGAKVGRAAGAGIGRGISAATTGISSGLSKLGPVLAAARGGFVAAAGAAKAFTIALLTNPIFLIIAALVALGVGLVILYKHSETFRAIVSAAWAGVQKVVEVSVGLIVGYVKFLVAVWSSVIRGGLAVLKGIFQAGWTLITGTIKAAVGLWLAPIKLQFDLIKLAITTALKVVKALFTGDFGAIPGILTNALKGVWTIFKDFGANVLTNLGDLSKTLLKAGEQLIHGLIEGIKNAGGGVYGAVKDTLGPVGRLLPGSPIKEGPLKGWNGGTPGKALVDLIAGGIASAGPRIPAAMSSALAGIDGGSGLTMPRLTVPDVAVPRPPVPSISGAGSVAAGTTTIDNSRHYDVDVHETTGPTTEGSLTRRLRALDTYGHAALSGRTG